jgi:hypothetical protein
MIIKEKLKVLNYMIFTLMNIKVLRKIDLDEIFIFICICIFICIFIFICYLIIYNFFICI